MRQRGQALAEFALVVPVLLLMFAAAADFGRAFYAYVARGLGQTPAVAAAFVIGWRRLGTRTPGPSPMRDVRSAANANDIHTSGLCCGVSYSHARA